MTPQEKQEFELMKRQNAEMMSFINSLKNTATIPYEVDASLRGRFGIDAFATGLTTSAKSATSETIAVNSATAMGWTSKKVDTLESFFG